MTLLMVALGVMVVFGLTLVVVGLRAPARQDTLEARLAELGTLDRPPTLEEIELSMPFVERIVRPIVQRMGELVTRLTPAQTQKQTDAENHHAQQSGYQINDAAYPVALLYGADNLHGKGTRAERDRKLDSVAHGTPPCRSQKGEQAVFYGLYTQSEQKEKTSRRNEKDILQKNNSHNEGQSAAEGNEISPFEAVAVGHPPPDNLADDPQ